MHRLLIHSSENMLQISGLIKSKFFNFSQKSHTYINLYNRIILIFCIFNSREALVSLYNVSLKFISTQSGLTRWLKFQEGMTPQPPKPNDDDDDDGDEDGVDVEVDDDDDDSEDMEESEMEEQIAYV